MEKKISKRRREQMLSRIKQEFVQHQRVTDDN
jgi:hypothetical protein